MYLYRLLRMLRKVDDILNRANLRILCFRNEFDQRFGITTAFLATHSGLTRWMDFQKPNNNYVAQSRPEYVHCYSNSLHCILFCLLYHSSILILYREKPTMTNFRSVDEVWYKRAVEQHYIEPQSFIYSVPFNEGKRYLTSRKTYR